MRLLPLLMIYCAWALPGQYKKRRRRKKKKQKPERVQIHQADLCTGCLSFVEDYQKTLSAIYEAGAMDGRREGAFWSAMPMSERSTPSCRSDASTRS